MEQNKKNLFTILQRGERNIEKAHKKAILICGLNGVGKSITYNWLIKKPMIGKGNPNTKYHNLNITSAQKDKNAAEIGHSFLATTIYPNVYKDFLQGVSLIDMPSFYQNSIDISYTNAIGPSYFYQAVYEQVQEIKFIIVINECNLLDDGRQMIKTFDNFVRIFSGNSNFNYSLKESVTIIFNKAKQSERHKQLFYQFIQAFKSSDLVNQNICESSDYYMPILSNKQLMVQILQNIYNANRFTAFKVAKNFQLSQPTNVLDKFEKIGWNYLKTNEYPNYAQYFNKSKVLIWNYQKLPRKQQKLFEHFIDKKISSYLAFPQILKQFFKTIKFNLEKFINNQQINRQLIQQKQTDRQYKIDLKMENAFYILQRSVQDLDDYDFQNQQQLNKNIRDRLQQSYQNITCTKMLKIYTQLFDILVNMSCQLQLQFYDRMNFQNLSIKQIIDLLRQFTTTRQQDAHILKLKYIFKRLTRNFKILYCLDQSRITDVSYKMIITSQGTLQYLCKEIIYSFFNSVNQDYSLLLKICPTFLQISQYQKLLYIYQYKNQTKINYSRSQLQFILSLAKGQILMNEGNYQKVLIHYTQALKYLQGQTQDLQIPLWIKQNRNNYMLKIMKGIACVAKSAINESEQIIRQQLSQIEEII